MKWVAFFSQTGSEIYNIAHRIRRPPNYILTNNLKPDTWHPGLEDLGSVIITGKHNMIMDMLQGMRDTPLVTLHGYLRILPKEIVEKHEVINGHPGDIVKYPELKGKDPQAKAIELGLPSTGAILHRAVAEVDAGEILMREERTIHAGTSTEQLIIDLKAIQLDLWCELLRGRL